MACLLVPGATAVVTTIMQKKVSPDLKLGWLNMMLWGGFIMLLVDHLANGEIVAYPPFFTAGWDKISAELLTVGLPMTLSAVLLWGVMVFISIKLKYRPPAKINT